MTNVFSLRWRTTAASVFSATLASVFLLGCAGGNPRLYEGSSRPAGEVAVLRVSANPNVRQIKIEGVNRDELPPGSYELLPGSYKVTVTFNVKWAGTIANMSGSGRDALPCTIIFEAQGGKTYRIAIDKRPSQQIHVTLRSTRWGTTEVYSATIVDGESGVKVSETCSTTIEGEIDGVGSSSQEKY